MQSKKFANVVMQCWAQSGETHTKKWKSRRAQACLSWKFSIDFPQKRSKWTWWRCENIFEHKKISTRSKKLNLWSRHAKNVILLFHFKATSVNVTECPQITELCNFYFSSHTNPQNLWVFAWFEALQHVKMISGHELWALQHVTHLRILSGILGIHLSVMSLGVGSAGWFSAFSLHSLSNPSLESMEDFGKSLNCLFWDHKHKPKSFFSKLFLFSVPTGRFLLLRKKWKK